MLRLFTTLVGLFISVTAQATEQHDTTLDLTNHRVGFASIGIFILAYTLVILEDKLHLRKSKPVLLAAGLIWILIALTYNANLMPHRVEFAIRENYLEYTELFFFLLVAMTYINAMLERGVFDELRQWMVEKGYSYRSSFWITGLLAFFILSFADNLTTDHIMLSV